MKRRTRPKRKAPRSYSCRATPGKRRFRDAAEANEFRRTRLGESRAATQQAYPCGSCKGWHLATRKDTTP